MKCSSIFMEFAQQIPIRIITKKFIPGYIIVKMLKDKILTATRENEFFTQQNYLSKMKVK